MEAKKKNKKNSKSKEVEEEKKSIESNIPGSITA
jgi:hypothetical protein